MELQEVDDVAGNYTGLSRRVLDYSLAMKRMVDESKRPDFDPAAWSVVSDMVDTDAFVRVGNFKEVMDWPTYASFLEGWAKTSDWECSFKRITESGRTVFLELEERSQAGEFSSVVNSVSVYEFDDADKLVHLDIYLQMPLPDPEMLRNYEGIEISESKA